MMRWCKLGAPRSRGLAVAALLFEAVLLASCGDGHLQAFTPPLDESTPPALVAPGARAPVAPTQPSAGDDDIAGQSHGFLGARLAPNDDDEAERDPDEPGLIIEDLEDGDTNVVSPYPALWYLFGDGRGEQALEVESSPLPHPGSHYSLHTTGVGFRDWGAGLGLALGAADEGVDVSEFEAIAFSARVDEGSERRVDLHLLNPDRDGDHELETFALKLSLSTEWRRYVVGFGSLRRFSGPVRIDGAFDPQELAHVQLLFLYPDAFSVWVDDIELVEECRVCGTDLH